MEQESRSVYNTIMYVLFSVVKPEPQGVGTFGRSRSRKAPVPGQTKVVY